MNFPHDRAPEQMRYCLAKHLYSPFYGPNHRARANLFPRSQGGCVLELGRLWVRASGTVYMAERVAAR